MHPRCSGFSVVSSTGYLPRLLNFMLYWPCWVGAWVKYRAVQNKSGASEIQRANGGEHCLVALLLVLSLALSYIMMLVALAWKATWECPYIYNLAPSYHHSHVKFALQTVASPHKPKALRICGEQLKLCNWQGHFLCRILSACPSAQLHRNAMLVSMWWLKIILGQATHNQR